MDVTLEEIEALFAQKLASGDPDTRRRALRTLCVWIKAESIRSAFTDESMLRLCKGIYYVMWMQDKMLSQEYLADKLAALLGLFVREEERIRYIKCMLKTLAKEWSLMDRWRMDKFLMLMRRLVRFLFHYLHSRKWNPTLMSLYISALKETVISSDGSIPEGLKSHFASLYLDELDGAGEIPAEKMNELLKPFADLLSDKKLSNYMFNAVLDEIFVSILHERAEEKAAHNHVDEEAEHELAGKINNKSRIKFHYGDISKMLLDVGKKKSVTSARREQLYALAKKFRAVQAGEDPFKMATKAETQQSAKIPEKELANAVSRLLKEQKKTRKRNSKKTTNNKVPKGMKKENARSENKENPKISEKGGVRKKGRKKNTKMAKKIKK